MAVPVLCPGLARFIARCFYVLHLNLWSIFYSFFVFATEKWENYFL